MSDREEWLKKACADPGTLFDGPEGVAARDDLSREEKVRILRCWEYDAAELSVATEENMPGPENDLLRRILLVLAELAGDDDAEKVAPSKQHGLSGD
ncbi:MAG TPA: hypothetical protein VFF18_10745 [Woeseiaceae bacterium]|nr:hypothetical protein [Woeseiaceae bacterium]